jgi:hypothetical protein
MIRTTFAASVASIAFAVLASAAHAAPIGGTNNLNFVKTPSPLVSVGGHQVCLKAQCPGRSRIVCGCAKPLR